MTKKKKSVTTFFLGIWDTEMKAKLPASPTKGAGVL